MSDTASTPPEESTTGRTGGLDTRLEAEIEAALGEMSLEDMLDLADRPERAGEGPRQRRTGTIVSIHGSDVFVEFGPKSQGVCPLALFDSKPEPGQKLEFIVDRFDKKEGLLILSRQGAVSRAEWETLDVGQSVEARCTGVNKGGLEMEVASHRAFMPAGQVDLRHIEKLEVFVGQKLPCEVLEIDRRRGRIILSRRAHLEVERSQLREKLLGELEIGRQMEAIITSIQPYGAFADLGGLDGLIHISDICWERIKRPEEKVKLGQKVQVQILKLDTEQDPPRVGLGMKQCIADPSLTAFEEITEGQVISGRVTKIMDFGAFVEVRPGVEGLVHISELSHERVRKVGSVVRTDQQVKAKVLSVDPASRRISLSLKALEDSEDGEALSRGEDPHLRKLKAQLSKKFADHLKGGLG